jgi:hypothetical protein
LNGPKAISVIIQIDNNSTIGDDYYPTINKWGQIVYYHAAVQFEVTDPPSTYTETGKYQLYHKGLLTTLNVTKNTNYPWNYYHTPALLFNDRGQLGYAIQNFNNNGNLDLYFHDVGGAPQLLSSTAPQWYLTLNQQGQMAWVSPDASSNFQIYLFNNGQVRPLTDYNYGSGSLSGYFSGLSLNDNGQAVWVEYTYNADNNLVYNVQLYAGGATKCIYSNENAYWIHWPQINNQGHVVWVEQVSGLESIMLYDGVSVQKISGGPEFLQGRVYSLQINSQGQVMWLGINDSINNADLNIYLYSKGKVTQVTQYQNNGAFPIIDYFENSWSYDTQTKFAPHLNNKGEIAWVTHIPNSSDPALYDMAVYVYSQGQIARLDSWTAIPYLSSGDLQLAQHAAFAQINDAGQVTWSRWVEKKQEVYGGHFEIFLATPVGSLISGALLPLMLQ